MPEQKPTNLNTDPAVGLMINPNTSGTEAAKMLRLMADQLEAMGDKPLGDAPLDQILARRH